MSELHYTPSDPAANRAITYRRTSPKYSSTKRRERNKKRLMAICAVCSVFVVGIVVVSLTFGLFRQQPTVVDNDNDSGMVIDIKDSNKDKDTQDTLLTFSFTDADVSAVDTHKVFLKFSLDENSAEPAVTEAKQSAVTNLIASIKAAVSAEAGDTVANESCGFILLNCSTGQGCAFNTQATFYSVNALRLAYAAYLCEEVFDAGLAVMSEWSETVEKSLVSNDTEAYKALREKFDDNGWDLWLSALGEKTACCKSSCGINPTYALDCELVLWQKIYAYLNSSASYASWLKTTAGKAETSYIKNALDEQLTASGSSGRVYACADLYTDANPWNHTTAGEAEPTYTLSCMQDSAFITLTGGNTYLMCVKTSLSPTEENQAMFELLCQSIFELLQ